MGKIFSAVILSEFTLKTNTATTPNKSQFCDRNNIYTIIAADSNMLLAVMRQVHEDIHNHNHILQEHISSLSEQDICTAYPHSTDDVIYQRMQRKFSIYY